MRRFLTTIVPVATVASIALWLARAQPGPSGAGPLAMAQAVASAAADVSAGQPAQGAVDSPKATFSRSPRMTSVARRAADGSVETGCFSSEEAARAFRLGTTPSLGQESTPADR